MTMAARSPQTEEQAAISLSAPQRRVKPSFAAHHTSQGQHARVLEHLISVDEMIIGIMQRHTPVAIFCARPRLILRMMLTGTVHQRRLEQQRRGLEQHAVHRLDDLLLMCRHILCGGSGNGDVGGNGLIGSGLQVGGSQLAGIEAFWNSSTGSLSRCSCSRSLTCSNSRYPAVGGKSCVVTDANAYLR